MYENLKHVFNAVLATPTGKQVVKRGESIIGDVKKPLTVSVAERLGGHDIYHRLVIDLCPTCDKHFTEFRNVDAGSYEEAVGIIYLCDSCTQDERDGKIDMECWSNWDCVHKIREARGLPLWEDSKEKFDKFCFDGYLKGEGKYPQWYMSNLDKADENDLQALADYYGYTFEEMERMANDSQDFYEEPEMSAEEVATMAWVYGVGPKPRHDMTPQDEAYEDLMQDHMRGL